MRSNQTYPTMKEMEALWASTLQPRLRTMQHETPSLVEIWKSLSSAQQQVFSATAMIVGVGLFTVGSTGVVAGLLGMVLPAIFLFPLIGGKLPRLRRFENYRAEINRAAADAWGLSYSPSVPDTQPSPDETKNWGDTFNAFKSERLIPEFSTKRCEDYIYGERYGMQFECFEADLKHRVKDSERTVFRGMLLRLSWPTQVKGGKIAFAPPMSMEFLRLKTTKHMKRYHPADPSLAKRLGFFTTDPVLGLATLTADKMERIEKLASRFNLRAMRGMARGDSLYLGFEMFNRFEHGDAREAVEDPAAFYQTLNDMMFVCELVRELSGHESALTEPLAKSA